jgi:hypothetical protein
MGPTGQPPFSPVPGAPCHRATRARRLRAGAGLPPPAVVGRGPPPLPPPLGTPRSGPPFSSASFKRLFSCGRCPFSSPRPISLDKSRATLHRASTLSLVLHHHRRAVDVDGIEAATTTIDVFG